MGIQQAERGSAVIITKDVTLVQVLPEPETPKSSFSFNPRIALLCVCALNVVAGAVNNLCLKYCYKQLVPPCHDCLPRFFTAPFLMLFLAFFAQTLCLGMYYTDRAFAKKRNSDALFEFQPNGDPQKPSCPFWCFCIPACCDFTATIGAYIASNIVLPSVVSVCSSFNFIVTACLTLVLLQVALRICNYAGGVLLVVGVALMAAGTILYPDTDSALGETHSWLGIMLACGSTFFYALQFVIEEAVLRKYAAAPLYVVGMEGVVGTIVSGTAVLIAHFAGAENFVENVYQVFNDLGVILGILGFILFVTLSMASGVLVTYLGSSLLRSVLFPLQTVVLYFAELVLLWAVFRGITCAGLIVTIIAILVFNNLIIFPGCSTCTEFMQRPIIFLCLSPPDDHTSAQKLESKLEDKSEYIY